MIKINICIAQFIPISILKRFGIFIELNKPPKFFVPSDGKGALALLQWSPNWMVDILSKLMTCTQPGFIDVGANVGQTLLAYKLVSNGRYIGIEPNPACSAFVDELLVENGMDDSFVITLALSDKNGFSSLYSAYATDTGATMMTNLRNITGRHKQIVSMNTFDNFLEECEFEDPGIIKIDVEAYELEVIRGMSRLLKRSKSIIICEVLGTAKDRPLEIKEKRNSEIIQLLNTYNYTVYNLQKSEDLKKIIKLKEINQFPNVYWSEENKESFDYIFVPNSMVDDVNKIFNE